MLWIVGGGVRPTKACESGLAPRQSMESKRLQSVQSCQPLCSFRQMQTSTQQPTPGVCLVQDSVYAIDRKYIPNRLMFQRAPANAVLALTALDDHDVFEWKPSYDELVALNALTANDVLELREGTIPDHPHITVVVPVGVREVHVGGVHVGAVRDYCNRVKEIRLSKTVVVINDNAFAYLTGLEKVVISTSVVRIGNKAFCRCTNLTSVTFEAGSTLELIDIDAFYRCENLPEFHCPPSVTFIGRGAFGYCLQLKTVTLSNLINAIPEFCFQESGIETLGETPLTITIPAAIESIGISAFWRCTNVRKVLVTNGEEHDVTIGRDAFYECSALKSAILHRVTTIADGAFLHCTDMRVVCMSERLVSCGSDLDPLILAVAGPPRKLGTLLDVWAGRKATEWDPVDSAHRPRRPVLHTPEWDVQWGDERQIGNYQTDGVNQIKKDRTPLVLISNVIQTALHPSVVSVDGRTDDPTDPRFNVLYNLAMLPDKSAARRALVLFAGYNRAIAEAPKGSGVPLCSNCEDDAATHYCNECAKMFCAGGCHPTKAKFQTHTLVPVAVILAAGSSSIPLPNITGFYDMALNVSLRPLMENSDGPWTTSEFGFPECQTEHAVGFNHNNLWIRKRYHYCTIERRHICGACHKSKEHAGHEHILSSKYYREHKFPNRWRWRLPLELKIMILGVPQVNWMPTLRAFNLV
jgi:hypothetical protein